MVKVSYKTKRLAPLNVKDIEYITGAKTFDYADAERRSKARFEQDVKEEFRRYYREPIFSDVEVI